MNEILLALILVVISIVGAVITKVLIPYIQSKIEGTKWENMIEQVKIAIQAAEQLGVLEQLTNSTEKYNYVAKYIKKVFPDITDDQIQLLIEGTGKALGIFSTDKEIIE